jgi:cytoskeletal protein CcmA (bactofilin family)
MWKRDQSVPPSTAPGEQSTDVPLANSKSAEKVVMSLGKSVVIKGELSGSEDLTLYGQMEGSVKLPGHTLTVGSDADIKAEISAKSVVIMGAITGNVTAGDKVEIQATGSVTGDIVSPRLVIVEGGCLNGRVQMPPSERSRVPK